jgi:hypothetical protein
MNQNIKIYLAVSAFIVPIILLVSFFNAIEFKNLENVEAFQSQSKTLYAVKDNKKIHCRSIADADQCIQNLDKSKSILMLGNSQLHTINQYSSKDLNAISILADLLEKKDISLIGISTPNVNMQEELLILKYVNKHKKLDSLILPIVFDDFRETGIRDGLNIESVSKEERRVNIIQNIELTFNNQLGQIIPLWLERSNIKSHISLILYKVRNVIFNIKSSDKRKIIRQNYESNMNAFKEILNYCKEYKVNLLVYIAPLRPSILIPYDVDEYNNFKLQIESLSKKEGAEYRNYEMLVEEGFWGETESVNFENKQIDYMHFTGVGHAKLGKKIYLDLILNK